jgi:chromosome partitioning related protein ParA
MLTLSVVATKGGVGKTTLAANLGGLLHDLGLRVLLVDADVQPSLTKYFKLSHEAPRGLTELVIRGMLTPECVSVVQLPPGKFMCTGTLDIVASDTRNGRLQDWLSNRLDRLVRISLPLKHGSVGARYDIVIIDTQGAVGHLQDAAVNAADLLIAPASPDIVSAREFIDGTLTMLDRHESTANLGFKIPAVRAVINRTERTVDSRVMSDLIREEFMTLRGRVSVLESTVPSSVAFRKAATMQVPVHWIDPHRAGDTMHQLLWELIPSLQGLHAPGHRAHSGPLIADAHARRDSPARMASASTELH